MSHKLLNVFDDSCYESCAKFKSRLDFDSNSTGNQYILINIDPKSHHII